MLRKFLSYGPLFPRLLQAFVTGGSAIVVYLITKNDYVTGVVVMAVSVSSGEVIARKVRPKARRVRPLSPHTMEQFEKLQMALNGDIHDAVNLLAALRAQMAFTKDALRDVIDELQMVEDTNLGRKRK